MVATRVVPASSARSRRRLSTWLNAAGVRPVPHASGEEAAWAQQAATAQQPPQALQVSAPSRQAALSSTSTTPSSAASTSGDGANEAQARPSASEFDLKQHHSHHQQQQQQPHAHSETQRYELVTSLVNAGLVAVGLGGLLFGANQWLELRLEAQRQELRSMRSEVANIRNVIAGVNVAVNHIARVVDEQGLGGHVAGGDAGSSSSSTSSNGQA